MRRRSSLVVLLLLALLTVVPAHAAERLVFVSVQGLEDSEQGQAVLERLRRTRLAPHGRFDHVRAEYQLWVPERVREAQVVAAIEATRPGATPMLRKTVLSVRSRCQRLMGSFWLRCDNKALARP